MEREDIAEAYRQAEASLRLEGMDPCGKEPYETLKAQVIAGEITPDEAHERTVAFFDQQAAPSKRPRSVAAA